MIRLSTGLLKAIMGDGAQDNSMRQLLAGGVVRFYSGTQPSSSDNAETGTLLTEVTLDGNAFVPGASGSSTNGLRFDASTDGSISKATAETWSGTGLAVGAAGWFRFYDSNQNTGASSTAIRIDGSVATSGGDVTMTSTTIGVGTPVNVPTFTITLPSHS